MGQQQKTHAEANAGNPSGPHDESPHGEGQVEGRPTSCGPLMFSAFACACIFLFLPHIVLSASGIYLAVIWLLTKLDIF